MKGAGSALNLILLILPFAAARKRTRESQRYTAYNLYQYSYPPEQQYVNDHTTYFRDYDQPAYDQQGPPQISPQPFPPPPPPPPPHEVYMVPYVMTVFVSSTLYPDLMTMGMMEANKTVQQKPIQRSFNIDTSTTSTKSTTISESTSPPTDVTNETEMSTKHVTDYLQQILQHIEGKTSSSDNSLVDSTAKVAKSQTKYQEEVHELDQKDAVPEPLLNRINMKSPILKKRYKTLTDHIHENLQDLIQNTHDKYFNVMRKNNVDINVKADPYTMNDKIASDQGEDLLTISVKQRIQQTERYPSESKNQFTTPKHLNEFIQELLRNKHKHNFKVKKMHVINPWDMIKQSGSLDISEAGEIGNNDTTEGKRQGRKEIPNKTLAKRKTMRKERVENVLSNESKLSYKARMVNNKKTNKYRNIESTFLTSIPKSDYTTTTTTPETTITTVLPTTETQTLKTDPTTTISTKTVPRTTSTTTIVPTTKLTSTLSTKTVPPTIYTTTTTTEPSTTKTLKIKSPTSIKRTRKRKFSKSYTTRPVRQHTTGQRLSYRKKTTRQRFKGSMNIELETVETSAQLPVADFEYGVHTADLLYHANPSKASKFLNDRYESKTSRERFDSLDDYNF